MKKIILIGCLVLAGCDDPNLATQQEFMLQYNKVQKECERIVLGEDTMYNCKNPDDTMLIRTHHSRPSTINGSGRNSGADAEWKNKKRYFRWDAPFQIY